MNAEQVAITRVADECQTLVSGVLANLPDGILNAQIVAAALGMDITAALPEELVSSLVLNAFIQELNRRKGADSGES